MGSIAYYCKPNLESMNERRRKRKLLKAFGINKSFHLQKITNHSKYVCLANVFLVESSLLYSTELAGPPVAE